MKKAVTTLFLLLTMSLGACETPNNTPSVQIPTEETKTETHTTKEGAQLTEDQILAQIKAAYLNQNPNQEDPDIKLFEKNGDISYYQANPSSLAGHIIYSGAVSLYSYTEGDLAVKSMSNALGSFVTDISSDNSYAVGFVLYEGVKESQIGARVTNLLTGEFNDYLVDNTKIEHQAASGVISEDSSKLAFSLTKSEFYPVETEVYVVDLTSGEMNLYSSYNEAMNLKWVENELKVTEKFKGFM